jgi:hypothetical protein
MSIKRETKHLEISLYALIRLYRIIKGTVLITVLKINSYNDVHVQGNIDEGLVKIF